MNVNSVVYPFYYVHGHMYDDAKFLRLPFLMVDP